MHSLSTSLVAYVAAASLLTVTPGLDTAFVLKTAAGGSRREAGLAALGVVSGCLAWAALVGLGLGALLAASQAAYAILRWCGAAYLLWVGLKMLRHPRPGLVSGGSTRPFAETARTRPFATGALTNLLNPKVGIFYVSFLPQFVPAGVPLAPYVLLLGVIHAMLGLFWFACLVAATRPLATWLRQARVVRACDRLTGLMFIAFGLGLALDDRAR